MKGLYFVLIVFSVVLLGSCCTKKGTCPAIKFQSFELLKFNFDEVKDSVNLIRYKGGTNFRTVLDTSFLKAEATDDPGIFKVVTQELSIEDDYALQVVKLNKLYRVNNFTLEKITCGKCFMRPNNQFGYQLNGYAVNNRYYSYDGIVQVTK